jgi:hypothetical protein
MGVSASEVGYTSATTRRGDHEVHKGRVVPLLGGGNEWVMHWLVFVILFSKNSGYFAWRPMHIYDNISLNSSGNGKSCRQKLYGKSKHAYYVQKLFFSKIVSLWDNVEKYGTARQATDDSTIRRMSFPCWISKSMDTHSGRVMIFHGKNSFAKAPQDITLLYTAYIVSLTNKIFTSSDAHSRKFRIRARFELHSRIVGLQYATCFMSPSGA